MYLFICFLFFSLEQFFHVICFTWLHLASLGFTWLHLASLWLHLASLGFWRLASGFWLWLHLALGFLAFGFWLLAFASLRILHWVCWPFGFSPLVCARGMKTLVISVLTSPFQEGKNRMSGHLLNLGSNYIHVIWVARPSDVYSWVSMHACAIGTKALFNKCPD